MSSEHLGAQPGELQEVALLYQRVRTSGQEVARLALNWWQAKDQIALVETEGSQLLIESAQAGEHAVVTVMTESVNRVDYDGPILAQAIFRRQGNPDSEIVVDAPMHILGLSRKSQIFDADSLFTTTRVISLRTLRLEK